MTHWHDTPDFDRIANDKIERCRATDMDRASHICSHGGTEYFMHEPRSGQSWFMCRGCCLENVTLELLVLSERP